MSETIMTYDQACERARQRNGLCHAVKTLLLDKLDLRHLDPSWITNDQPLAGRGLELDSVETIEIGNSLEYGFEATFTDDDIGALGSVNALVDFIEANGGGTRVLALAQAPPVEGPLPRGDGGEGAAAVPGVGAGTGG